ncbi:MAG: hypothetical protein L3J93_04705 [Thermoplasmata archaeon]|nr:hypothetical protein [Thermoplasmata archaeon]
MSPTWKEAYRLHVVAFTELAYQAIYAVRQGNLPPTLAAGSLARKARRRVLQSKLLVSLLLAFITIGTGVVLGTTAKTFLAPALAAPLYDETVIAGLLLLDVAFLWWTGLQVLPSYLSSQVLPTLDALPVPDRSVSRAAFLLFLRLFDLPALTVIAVTPIVVGRALGSAWAGLAIIPGAVSAVVFGLALSLATGKFFLRHVQGATGGSRRGTVLRWAYLVLWTIPAFTMYGYVSLGPGLIGWMTSVTASGAGGALDGILATYPFPLASLPSLLLSGSVTVPDAGLGPIAIVVVGGAVYGSITWAAASWLLDAPGALARASAGGHAGVVTDRRLVPRSAPFAVIVKDLRIASRTPGFAFIILLPLLDAVAIGAWTVLAAPTASGAFNIASAAVATAALLATFFGPAFFAIEVMGYSYTRTLPLTERSLVLGKLSLVTTLYAVAAGTVLGIGLARLFEPLSFLGFILAEFPAVAAAALLELGLLVRVARRRGLPVTNLYSGSWWVMGVSIPGVLMAGVPLALFEIFRSVSVTTGLGVMAAVALAELAVAAPLALAGSSGRGA